MRFRFYALTAPGVEELHVAADSGPDWARALSRLNAAGVDFEVRETGEHPLEKCLTPSEAADAVLGGA